MRWPVAMTASASKKTRSFTCSSTGRSATMAWAPCLTWASAKIADAVGAQPRAIAHRARRLALDEALIGDIGIGPLVDADEGGAGRAGDRERRDGGVGEHVDADRLAEVAADAVGDDRHVGRRLRADVVGLGERHVAMVLDDDAVAAAIEIGARIGEAALVDRLDRLAVDSAARPAAAPGGRRRSPPWSRPKMARTSASPPIGTDGCEAGGHERLPLRSRVEAPA